MENTEQGLRGWSGRMAGIFSGAAWYRRGAGFVLAVSIATMLAALALPVPRPGPEIVKGSHGIPDGIEIRTPAPRDLRVFLESRRWGDDSLQDVQQRAAGAEAGAAKRQAGAEVRLVGLTMMKDRHVSLIRFPDGAIARFLPGDRLPDGRSVKLATNTTLTLEGIEDTRTEVLNLFPTIPAESPPAEPDAETQGLPVESDATPAS